MTTKSNGDCKTGLCHYDSATRTKFFNGMLLTDEQLRAEQTYHREALKRINRHLWGSGIVCGLEVAKTGGFCVTVHPGLALDCHGNVIEIDKCITIDLSEVCRSTYPDPCAPKDKTKVTKYLVVRYAETTADPQPVHTPADDCAPTGSGPKSEPSQYREGFCLEFWDKCPHAEPCEPSERKYAAGKETQERPGAVTALLGTRQSRSDPAVRDRMKYLAPDCMESPPCPECDCPTSAVGLAQLEIDCGANTVDVSCECRYYVWSPRLLRWLVCRLFNEIENVRPDAAGLSRDARPLPTANRVAGQPLRAAWDAATEYAVSGDHIRNLLERVDKLESRILDLSSSPGRKRREKDTET